MEQSPRQQIEAIVGSVEERGIRLPLSRRLWPLPHRTQRRLVISQGP
jgi:hypothetical protein